MMRSLWNDKTAEPFANNPLAMRVYTSRLLGQESSLVLHGGGNTSVKADVTNLFGETEELLYVKGSGWDLATIEAAGFAPVRMKVLKQMAELDQLSDTDMVKLQRSAMTDPAAPNPSVEAILHALIPFAYVDHTHTDAVVTISNTEDGEARIRELYGDRVLIVPYVMPGFILAKTIADLTRNADWSVLDGIILLNHGLFTFADDARASYENMIELVSMAEQYLEAHAQISNGNDSPDNEDLLKLTALRRAVSKARGKPVITYLSSESDAIAFSRLANIESISTRGPLTPDHVIRTKRTAMIIGTDTDASVEQFTADYQSYFDANSDGSLTCLDRAPRWAVWPGHGTLSFDTTQKGAAIIADIIRHTRNAITKAEALGGWQALPESDIFELEYWELEQAKLKKSGTSPMFSGKVALVTGAASGIGQACVQSLLSHGAVICAVDINPVIVGLFNNSAVIEIVCDVTHTDAMKTAVDDTVRHFGGLDILISNAGLFPVSERIEQMNELTWDKSMAVNLTSHQQLMTVCIPYLKQGIDPAIVIMASKNVPAPGPGVSAYSVAKAGLTQLARVAALELGEHGIRVNALHPNAVFDTAIWTDEVLEKRARNYGLSIEEYKTNNILKVEVTSRDVAELASQLAGPVFAKTTGSQISIDGGNDRVI
jgi:rhamnose utilization protein RhaD (predicted bifunctional aldolase and dehydrogenase)/NAD(P)-dependent dehydrogenase (short-subunit alcohol dehydrogenase family)